MIRYFKTSALTGEGIEDAFLEMAGKLASQCEDDCGGVQMSIIPNTSAMGRG